MSIEGTGIEEQYREKGFALIAGVDEAGRGPLAGPVVAAAVVFGPGVMIAGVDDSKKLSAERREQLAVEIRRMASGVGVGIVSPEEIDRVNILQATNRAMIQAVAALSDPPDMLLIDGNSFRHESLRFVNIVDGDALCFAIAAASIVAKVERDKMMVEYDRQYPGYDFARHKGYGTPQHLAAIRKLGLCPIHRRTFRMNLEGQETVDRTQESTG